MLNQPLPDLNAWVRFFSEAELPVLRQTVRRLEDAQRNIDRIGGRELAEIIGAHRNTVSNSLAHLRKRGLVAGGPRPIAVADVEGLRRYLDEA